MLTILTRTAVFVLSLLWLPAAFANDYFVEAVVFAWNNDGDSSARAERWKIAGREPAKMPARVRNQNDNPAVANDRRLLTDAASRLVNSGTATVLKHQAWTQFRAGRGGSPQVVFDESVTQAAELQLSGWIRIYESSLLYIEVDLALEDPNAVDRGFNRDSQNLNRPDAGVNNPATPPAITDSSVENRDGVTVTTDAQGNVSFSNRGSETGNTGYSNTLTGAASPGLTWRIEERRRVKFNEIHYIDHPKFGVLFTIARNESS